MTTKNSSYSRIVAVWLVLLAFLCGMIMPSLALAIQDMDIAMEGDPEDGLDFAGGGGGFSSGDNDQSSSQDLDPDFGRISLVFNIYPKFNVFLLIPLIIHDNNYSILLDDIHWRAKR